VPDTVDPQLTAWIETVVVEGERFGVVAQQLATGRTPVQGGLDVRVPWVPDWTARDLVEHLGGVHRWVLGILRAGSTEPPPRSPAHPSPDDVHGWFAVGLSELVATLRDIDPAAPAWHMSPTAPKVARSWARRQAHEHVVHRLDLEAAAGVAHEPVDPVIAEDGVDELLRIVVPRWAHTEPLASARGTVAVHATDTGRSWLVELGPGRSRTTDGAAAADCSVSGTAEQLLRRLWGRPAEVSLDGDPAVEARLRGR